MKFQKPSMDGSKSYAMRKKSVTRGRINGRTDKYKAIYLTNFFEVGGIDLVLLFSGSECLKVNKGERGPAGQPLPGSAGETRRPGRCTFVSLTSLEIIRKEYPSEI